MTKASFNQNKYSTFYYTFRLSWESFADISIKFSPSKNQVIRRAKLLVLVGYWCCVVGEGDTSPCGGKILDSRFSVLDSPFSTPICSSPRVLKIAIKPRTLVRTCDCVSVLFARVCVLVLQ